MRAKKYFRQQRSDEALNTCEETWKEMTLLESESQSPSRKQSAGAQDWLPEPDLHIWRAAPSGHGWTSSPPWSSCPRSQCSMQQLLGFCRFQMSINIILILLKNRSFYIYAKYDVPSSDLLPGWVHSKQSSWSMAGTPVVDVPGGAIFAEGAGWCGQVRGGRILASGLALRSRSGRLLGPSATFFPTAGRVYQLEAEEGREGRKKAARKAYRSIRCTCPSLQSMDPASAPRWCAAW